MENLFNSFQNNPWFVNVLIIGGILWFIIDTFFADIFTKDDSKYKVQKRDDGKYILTDKATGEVHIINAKDSLKYGFKIEGIVYDTQQKKSSNESVNFKTKSAKYKVQKRKDGKYILTNKATREVHVINAKDSLKYGIKIKGIEYDSVKMHKEIMKTKNDLKIGKKDLFEELDSPDGGWTQYYNEKLFTGTSIYFKYEGWDEEEYLDGWEEENWVEGISHGEKKVFNKEGQLLVCMMKKRNPNTKYSSVISSNR